MCLSKMKRGKYIMNKIINWVRTHKKESEDIAGLSAFAIILFAIFCGNAWGLAVCGISALLTIGANLTA